MPPPPCPGPARPPPSPAAALLGRHARAFAARPRTRRPLATRVPPPRSIVRPPARPGRTASGARFGAALPIPPTHTHARTDARAPLMTPLLPPRIWACSTQPEVWGDAHLVGVVVRVNLLIWFGRVAWLAASGRGVREWDAWARALAGCTTLRRAGVLSSELSACRWPSAGAVCSRAEERGPPRARTQARTRPHPHTCVLRWYTHSPCPNLCSRVLHARTRRRRSAEQSTHARLRTRTRARSSARVASRRVRDPDPPRAAAGAPPAARSRRPLSGPLGRSTGRGRVGGSGGCRDGQAEGWRLARGLRRPADCAASVGRSGPTSRGEGRCDREERRRVGATVWVGGARPVWGGDCPRTAWLSCRLRFVRSIPSRASDVAREIFWGPVSTGARPFGARRGAGCGGGGVCGVWVGGRGADATPHTSSASAPS